MYDLMKTNCYDINNTMVIVGSCMENTHINMVITKIIGMLSRVKTNKIVYASVDKSPHCIQLHYIDNEVRKALDLKDTEIVHYVGVDNKLIKIEDNIISLSKNLYKLSEVMKDFNKN